MIPTSEENKKPIGQYSSVAYDVLDAPEDVHMELMHAVDDILDEDA